MADPEHLALAKQGLRAIARWRENHWARRQLDLSEAVLTRVRWPGADLSHDKLEEADLTGANLRQASLDGANLAGAHLSRANLASADLLTANLQGTTLVRADLRGARLAEAMLQGADLTHADLTHANLERANLQDADLTEAKLTWANLQGARLRGAKLTGTQLELADLAGADLRDAQLVNAALFGASLWGVKLEFTLLINCDLSQAVGLEEAEHFGPSCIGLDTLARSRGRIPAEFLRLAGTPAPLVEAQAKLATPAYGRTLLVASALDGELAARLQADLRQAGRFCWTLAVDDESDLQRNENALQRATFFEQLALFCGKNTLGNPIAWRFLGALARREGVARQSAIVLLLDGTLAQQQDEVCEALRQLPALDFRGFADGENYMQQRAALLEALNR